MPLTCQALMFRLDFSRDYSLPLDMLRATELLKQGLYGSTLSLNLTTWVDALLLLP